MSVLCGKREREEGKTVNREVPEIDLTPSQIDGSWLVSTPGFDPSVLCSNL